MGARRKTHGMTTRRDAAPPRSGSEQDGSSSSDDETTTTDGSSSGGRGIGVRVGRPTGVTKKSGGAPRSAGGAMPQRGGGLTPQLAPLIIQMLFEDANDADAEEEDADDDDAEEDSDDDGYTPVERRYLASLPRRRKAELRAREAAVRRVQARDTAVPPRFRILQSGMDDRQAAVALQRVKLAQRSDRAKVQPFLDCITRLPFGKLVRMPIADARRPDAFLRGVQATLDAEVYGLAEVKRMFMIQAAKWAANPDARGMVIGLKGPAGVGKTTLVKDGIGRALGLPCAFIPLGSANDAVYLVGHSYTYEGSVCGRIAEALMTTGVMNPILCFDELDKVADNSRGAEIYNVLIHLTDPIQNAAFCDKYLGDSIPLDLSRCTIVFTYNDAACINPILRNRLVEIAVPDYSVDEKRHIVKTHVVPKALAEFRGAAFGVRALSDDAVAYVVARNAAGPSSSGLRGVQHDVAHVLGAVHLELALGGGRLACETEQPVDGVLGRACVERVLQSRDRGADLNGALPEGVRHMYM